MALEKGENTRFLRHLFSDPVVRDGIIDVRKRDVFIVGVWVMGEVMDDPGLELRPEPLPRRHQPPAAGADEPEDLRIQIHLWDDAPGHPEHRDKPPGLGLTLDDVMTKVFLSRKTEGGVQDFIGELFSHVVKKRVVDPVP